MSSIINPFNVVPKYHQLAAILKRKIDEGDWKTHTPIPSERQLEPLYNVSRATIRQAIDLLVRQGYLYREHGRGTFVSPQKLQKGIQELTSFSEDMLSRGMKPGQIILEVAEVEPTDQMRQRLEITSNTQKLTKIDRVRTGDGTPMGIQTSYLLLPQGQSLTCEEVEVNGSIYSLMSEKFHLIPTEADETLEVVLATPREAELLDIAESSPLLLTERTTYSQNRRPFEFVKILYRGDRYKYFARLTRLISQ
ncbi:MAG: GntR family transcriptional regulator [Anaerolineaceae bacterium]|nr:GntR family transcriptional regulator [Anaerolineaceae bacterium]